jgi:hypothetical protein
VPLPTPSSPIQAEHIPVGTRPSHNQRIGLTALQSGPRVARAVGSAGATSSASGVVIVTSRAGS